MGSIPRLSATYLYQTLTMLWKLIKEVAEDGLAKNMTLRDIALKHKVSLKHIVDQAKKGIEVEKEHTGNYKKALQIAKDHLAEDPNYYTKLTKAGL
jgi:hypothetical protein